MTSAPIKTRVREPRAGEGQMFSDCLYEWLGIRFSSVIDEIDGGRMVNNAQYLQAARIIEDRDSGQPYGVILAGPATKFAEAMPNEFMADAIMQLAVKISGVAVDPAFRGRGLGRLLMKRIIAEYRAHEYLWMYGQCADTPELIAFYKSLGFRLHQPGATIEVPQPLGGTLLGNPEECWFEQKIRTDIPALSQSFSTLVQHGLQRR